MLIMLFPFTHTGLDINAYIISKAITARSRCDKNIFVQKHE